MLLQESGDNLQTFDEFCSLCTAMGFHQAYDYIDALLLKPVRLLQHQISLADTRRIAQVHLQPSPLGTADHAQEVIRSFSNHNDSPCKNQRPSPLILLVSKLEFAF